jgi:hypothetical protein
MGRLTRYKQYPTTTLAEVLGDFVVYRNLVPVDARLPAIDEVRAAAEVPEATLPRKSEPAYARVVAEILKHARQLDAPDRPLHQLVYIGDTQMNDGAAFRNLCEAEEWLGWAFIGHERPLDPPHMEIQESLYLANRWSALENFVHFVDTQGGIIDASTAVVVDIDKTFIGARGRNDHVINAARVEGVERTVADLLGADFDAETFRRAYDALNRTVYHPFTADNQDYLAYICLMVGAGLYALDALLARVDAGELEGFVDFIAEVQRRRGKLAATGLVEVHDRVWARVQAGDPTPFKAFRYNEYLTTVARFGALGDQGPDVEALLARRIVITQEVWETVAAFKARGALVFGVSDKPDEASLPTAQQAAQGMRPLHHLTTPAVGAV